MGQPGRIQSIVVPFMEEARPHVGASHTSSHIIFKTTLCHRLSVHSYFTNEKNRVKNYVVRPQSQS